MGFFNRNSLSSINVNSKHLKECNMSVFWSILFVLVPKAEQQTRLQGPSLAVLVFPRIYKKIFFNIDLMLSSYIYWRERKYYNLSTFLKFIYIYISHKVRMICSWSIFFLNSCTSLQHEFKHTKPHNFFAL